MTTASSSPQPRLRIPGVVPALAATGAVGLLGAALGAGVGGRPQVQGALLGAAVVAGFFLLGSVGTGLAAAYAPRLSLVVALLTYTFQVVLLGALLVAVARSGASPGSLDVRWLGGAVLAGTLCWTAALLIDAGVRR
jgi:hypothetical protein